MEFSSFRKTAWDPVLILSQIATVQCFGYSTFSFCMVVANLLTDIPLGPQLLFDSRLVRGDTVEGWVIGGGLLAIGFTNILPLVYMVERSRLCIDFSLTFYIIHLILVWWHQGGPPNTLLWWLVVGASGSAMAFVGRAACLRRELLPIAIRNFLPSHPREDGGESHNGPVGVEEHELETRDPADGLHRDAPSMDSADGHDHAPRRKETEVLFDGSHLDEDEDDGVGNSSGATKTSKPQEGGDAQDKGEESDGWDNDNWGEDDEDDVDDVDNATSAAAAALKAKSPALTSASGASTPFATASHSPPSHSRAATPSGPRKAFPKGDKDR